MKIIDSVIVNDLYELDLLLLKLRIESPCVSEFIINECSHDYRGRRKGLMWAEAIENDERFAPYRRLIKVNSIDENLSGINPESIGSIVDPHQCAEAEWKLRDYPTNYLVEKYCNEDRVFTSDVDEVMDFEDDGRRSRLLDILAKPQAFQIERIRYSFDFDVRSWRSEGDIVTPVFRIEHLKNGTASLRDKKWKGDLVSIGDNPLAFEYCHCFKDREAVHAKHQSSLHTQWDRNLIVDALNCAHWPKTLYQVSPSRGCRWDWFERVKLTENNSPRYVREHFEELKTGIVPADYLERRKRLYGHDGYHTENIG